MTNPSSMSTPPDSASRPVLLWRPDSDESQVLPSVEEAARLLNSTPEAVVTAIEAGDLLEGWFLDWQVT
jgi:hypothetical protein